MKLNLVEIFGISVLDFKTDFCQSIVLCKMYFNYFSCCFETEPVRALQWVNHDVVLAGWMSQQLDRWMSIGSELMLYHLMEYEVSKARWRVNYDFWRISSFIWCRCLLALKQMKTTRQSFSIASDLTLSPVSFVIFVTFYKKNAKNRKYWKIW